MDNSSPVFTLLYTAPPGLGWGDAAVPDFLSAAERGRLAGMRFAKRRRSWLLGRWAAKRLLQQALPGHPEPAQIEIANEPGGAPRARITGEPIPGCLTISHREDSALAAFTPDPRFAIGADLEWVENDNPDFLIDYLSPLEQSAAAGLPPIERAQWMYLCWSAKEAVLKALRIGLRADPRDIELLDPAAGMPQTWTALDARSRLPGAENLRLWWQPRGNWVLTLAVLNGPADVTFVRLD